MILNNYNNILKDNVETKSTYIIPKEPILFVRQFDFNLTPDKNLVIPYYVNAFDDYYYKENKIGETFTIIIRLDEDTLPDDLIKEFKQTTFAGEQIIDVGPISKLGVHSFSIKVIQSNGVGSAVQYFKFIVRDTKADILDLNEISNFKSNEEYSEKEYYGLSRKIYYNGKEFVYPISTKTGKRLSYEYKSKIVNNAKYTVSVHKDNNTIKDIQIDVIGNIEYYPLTGSNYDHVVDITGTYYLNTTYKLSNGDVKSLKDEVDTPADKLPKEAVITAAKNKVALTRLFEAVKAYGKDGVKLPKMDIIIDYHSADGTKTITYSDKGRCDIDFPNNFIIDFNNSQVKALQTIDISGGKLIWLTNNFNTHIKNLILAGNYKNYDWEKSKTSGAGKTSEALSSFAMHRCSFCSIQSSDISYSVGYELLFGEDIPGSLTSSNKPPFTKCGYIDYLGQPHNTVEKDSDSVEQYWYTDDFADIPFRRTLQDYYLYIGQNHFRFCKAEGVNGRYNGVTRRGLMDSFFIHYYNSDKQFIKTVKVRMQDIIIPPFNAVYFKLSVVGIKTSGQLDSLNKSDNKSSAIILYSNVNSFCNVVQDCKVHDVRSCLGLYSGNQQLVKNLMVWNIAQDPTKQNGFGITTLLVDVEDMSWLFNNQYVENFEYLYGDVRAFNVIFSHKVNLNYCKNIGIVLKEINGISMKGCSNSSLRLKQPEFNFYDDLNLHAENSYFTRINNERNKDKCRSELLIRKTYVDQYNENVIIKN